jgi:uncharacterized membrane protein YphA (DoxX/SURF4 family)
MSLPGTPIVAAMRVREIVTSPTVRWIALLAVCAAYFPAGFDEATDFSAAAAELSCFGATSASLFVVITVVVEAEGSFLVLSGLYRRLGALGLADLKPVASMLANPFWSLVGQERVAKGNVLFEHVGLARAFLLVARHDWTAHRPASG